MKKLILIQRIIALLIILALAVGIPVCYWIDNYPRIEVRYIDRVIEKEKVITKVKYISDIDWQEFEVTAYTQYDEGCNNITSIGVNLNKSWTKYFNFVAVDPDVIPYGTTVYIKTDNEIISALAVDTGGAIKGKRLDLYVNDLNKAFEFGRRNLLVGVVDWNN